MPNSNDFIFASWESICRKIKRISYCDDTYSQLLDDFVWGIADETDGFVDIRDDLEFRGFVSPKDLKYYGEVDEGHLYLKLSDWKKWPNLMKLSQNEIDSLVETTTKEYISYTQNKLKEGK